MGVVNEDPLPKGILYLGNDLLQNYFNQPLKSFSRNEMQFLVNGLERFKLLAISDEGGYMFGSVEIVNDTNT